MKRLSLLILTGVVAAVLAGCGSGHHAKGDSDHAADCWAHADLHGHRHCGS
jgi:hypothetical protein